MITQSQKAISNGQTFKHSVRSILNHKGYKLKTIKYTNLFGRDSSLEVAVNNKGNSFGIISTYQEVSGSAEQKLLFKLFDSYPTTNIKFVIGGTVLSNPKVLKALRSFSNSPSSKVEMLTYNEFLEQLNNS